MSIETDYPCPFCGHEPVDIPVNRGEPAIVACLNDGCPICDHEFGIEEWETRAGYICPVCHGESAQPITTA
jgi:Zn finger protein HypA/HybF involved in hydrogenase expression